MTGDAAKTALQKLGLKVTVSRRSATPSTPASPSASTRPPDCTAPQPVTLTVSKGPQLVYIPSDIENCSPDHAKSYLQGLGLK